MNKKVLFAFFVLLICITLIVVSYLQWDDKLSSHYGNIETKESVSSPPVKTKPIEKTEESVVDSETLKLIANQDESVQTVFQDRITSGEKVQFLITGSDLLNSGDPGYGERLKVALEEAYGDSIEVTVNGFDQTIAQFTQDNPINVEAGYDVVLFEPFTLRSNGEVEIGDQLDQIETFNDNLKEQVKDVALVINPSNPIHAATIYPSQVETVKTFVQSEKIPYIDHWEDWPDPNSDEIVELLDEDSAPNSSGAEIWAEALIEYFIAK